MNEQELNKKLAEWAGLDEPIVLPDSIIANPYITVDGLFTQSLDACFKWLVPKTVDRIMAEQQCSSDIAYAILFKKWLQELELIIPDAALALCLAIEKLIGGERGKIKRIGD